MRTPLEGALRRKSRNRPLTRREYKLVLQAAPLRADADAGYPALRSMLDAAISTAAVPLDRVETQFDIRERRTWYLDTPGRSFRAHGLSLRVREEAPGAETPHRVTLRARSSDRLLAASADLRTEAKGRRRFEEEIVPWPLGPDGTAVVFSHACTVTPDAAFAPVEIGTAAALFPVLARVGGRDDRRLTVVRGLVARETVHYLCRVRLPEETEARFWLADWRATDGGAVCTAELSFDMDLDEKGGAEQLGLGAVTTARAIFLSLLAELDDRDWIDRRTATKTDFAYDRARGKRPATKSAEA